MYAILCLLVPWMVTDIFNMGKDLQATGIAFGFPFMIYLFVTSISSILLKFISCDSMPKQNAVISIVASISMLVFQILFIGILRWNMKGYLFAGFLSEAIATSWCLGIFFFSKQPTIRVRFRFPRLSSLYAMWTFSCGTMMKTIFSFLCNILVMRWILTGYGKDVVAIYSLGRQVNSLVYAVACGYLDSIQTLASMFRGEKNQSGLISTWRRGFFYGIRTQFILVVIMFFMAPVLVKTMLSADIDYDMAVWGLRVMIPFLIFSYPMDFRIIFYNACGHAKLVSLCSICNEIITHTGSVALFFFSLASLPATLTETKWFWFSWGIDRIGQFLMVVLLAEIWRRWKTYSNRMLLDPESKTTALSFIMKDSAEDLEDYRKMLGMFMKRNGLEEKQIRRTKLLFEELFLFAAEKVKDVKQKNFYLSAKIEQEQNVRIDLKYDSSESSLNSILNTGIYNVSLDKVAGAKILRNMSDFMRVDRVLGLNIVSIDLHGKKTASES